MQVFITFFLIIDSRDKINIQQQNMHIQEREHQHINDVASFDLA